MPCPGIRDETEAVRPLAMCQECQHWQADTGPVVRPHVVVIHRADHRFHPALRTHTVTTNIARAAVVAACADMIRACGLTLVELAQHLGEPLQAAPVKKTETAGPVLSDQARAVLALADRSNGITVADVCDALQVHYATGSYHVERLVRIRLLTKVKVAGEHALRYWSNPAHTLQYVEAKKAQADEQLQADMLAAEARQRQAEQDAAARAAESAADKVLREQARAAKAATAAASKPQRAPKQPASRTERLAKGKENLTFSQPKSDDTVMRPQGDAIRTDKTVETIDATVRPTAKWQMQQLPPDPRYPSFASMRPGVDPRTGKAWEGRA